MREYLTESDCPGCGTTIEWDTEGSFWWGEEYGECPSCGATLYKYGTAECCWRLERLKDQGD